MPAVELYWLPLGAGGWFVALNGRVYERLVSLFSHRPPQPLFHAALIVHTRDESYTIELCPEQNGEHGRVAVGAVGSRHAARFATFRYECRCWRDGSIPDIEFAVGGPVVVSDDEAVARKVIDSAPNIPTPVWGRDELGAGEMWNSNSVIAWLLERAGVDAIVLHPPEGGRAPGWRAGVVEARRA